MAGKLILCLSDPRQIFPVVSYGNKYDIINASIISSPQFSDFQIMNLQRNMRLAANHNNMNALEYQNQINYQEFINGIATNTSTRMNIPYGMDENDENVDMYAFLIKNIKTFICYNNEHENTNDNDHTTFEDENESDDENETIASIVQNDEYDTNRKQFLSNLRESSCKDKLIEWLYPNGFNNNDANNNTILAMTNKDVDEWNQTIADMNDNEEQIMLSTDEFMDVDDPYNHLKNMINDKVLNAYDKANIPPHELKLKVHDICIIVRNMNVNDGISNNSRVRIIRICIEKYILVELLDGSEDRFYIPRIKFQFKVNRGYSFEMCRVQYPLRRAYAMTFNKSQGQTLKKVVLDLRGNSFAHGLLYVGFSRVTNYNNIAIYVNENNIFFRNNDLDERNGCACIENLVYSDMLKEFNIY